MSADRPLVSVVMPSFNQASFIEAAARSALEQDYPSLELVVADGGSTDGTVACLQALQAEFGPRLRWVSEKDAGPANAVNKALSMAAGGIIGWLNSDDLYGSGAVSRAVAFLEANPDMVKVYGEGEHIDAGGRTLNSYPTLPPSAGIAAFQDGCFICQPTVFLRREVFAEVGSLDEGIATAFDFELWLRAFRRFAGRIGHIAQVQAYSRLHADCITQRLRRQVAVDGVTVLARHFGKAPVHWVLTYLDELCASYPFGDTPADLRAHIDELVGQLKDCFDVDAQAALSRQLAGDARLKLALPGVFADVHADGWAGQALTVRLRNLSRYTSSLRLQCSHARPGGGSLALTVSRSWGGGERLLVEQPGPFEVVVRFPGMPVGDEAWVSIVPEQASMPAAFDPRCGDRRLLGFKVHQLQLN
ncbi:MAG: glycosyltransferase family 2 protein [Noviherbaspirillum sp.]